MSEENYYPCLNLFYKLREAGLSLGIDSYNDLISCLQRGYGLENKDVLYGLCQRLWIDTSNEKEKQIFQECFDEAITFPSNENLSLENVSKNPSSLSSAVQISDDKPALKQYKKTDLIPETLLVEGEKRPKSSTEAGSNTFWMEPYPIGPTELPLSRWDYQQILPNLRVTGGKQLSTKLDVKATIAQIDRQGIFLEAVLKSQLIDRQVLVLIDRDGSAVPFHPYYDEFDKAFTKPFLRKQIYYFHNCPINYIYKDKFCLEGKPINKVFGNLKGDRTAVLIFSDGGAARGGINQQRVEQTKNFLNKLPTPYIAWLNPMPDTDWKNTTAGQIQKCRVPMFEHTRQGLKRAVSELRRPAEQFKSWT